MRFTYLNCVKCDTAFVDPVPDEETFERMYAKLAHFARYSEGGECIDHSNSAHLLHQNLKEGATVMDYGCGSGGFLKACASVGLIPFGIEFDSDAAAFAAQSANCKVISIETFDGLISPMNFDAIHLGDVLEHLPDPAATLIHLCQFLNPGGVFFIEGPLERNPSLVFWAARFFGALKRLIKPIVVQDDPPMHLFLTNAHAQKAFFSRLDKDLIMSYWQVYESGWPYSSGGLIKRCIAGVAIFMGGRKFSRFNFGNRFRTILVRV